ncbi:hypothetical protein PUNSTDRAFT_118540, partial [Punctularia strigosozonata HHB-11173 SS5]|uniref:uncharacterized protein n=1 Tax=Punctularia strigosozonata (strain HHB-11173) TaxID=741275 RepID=UPI0004417765
MSSFIFNGDNKLMQDIWTAHLEDRSLALGARKKALWLPDIDTGRGFRSLHMQSDVFSVHQKGGIVYAGARNGTIGRFDMRAKSDAYDDMFSGTLRQRQSSVTYLEIVREWELLLSTVSGELATYDLRFPRARFPLRSLLGHVNSYNMHL